MGVCPIPTSEGDKKTKMETIIKRYDPVSRRTYDIRIECINITGPKIPPGSGSVCRSCPPANKKQYSCR